MAKNQIELRFTVNPQLMPEIGIIREYYDNDPLGKILYPGMVILVKKMADEVPEPFKRARGYAKK